MSASLDALDRWNEMKREAELQLATRGGRARRDSMAYVRPVPSEALAVHPAQVAEAREHALRYGCPTDFLPDGRPLIKSRKHMKMLCSIYGYYNRDAGYGDQAPGMPGRARDRRVLSEAELREQYNHENVERES